MRALLIAAVIATQGACGSPVPPGEMHVIPSGLIGVGFKGLDTARAEPMSLDAAKARIAELGTGRDGPPREGDQQWFFRAFDRVTLRFFVARFHQACEGLGCRQYVVEAFYDVPRSPEAVVALGVEDDVKAWEVGILGVRAGMTEAQVTALRGQPESRWPEQYAGWETWMYRDLRIVFIQGRAAFVNEL